MRRPAALLAAALARGASAATVTIYDVLAEDCRGDVTRKNFGDPAGDAYFNVKDIYLPVACAKCKKNPLACRKGSDPAYVDCSNPESKTDRRERVVRKVEVEHSGAFGQYAMCSVPANSCSYTCVPPGIGSGLGRKPVSAGPGSIIAPTPGSVIPFKTGKDAADYWNYNTANILGGYWYSSSGSTKGTVIKSINAACQSRWLYTQVQAIGASCFNACPNATDQKSECWVRCFFETTLGKGSDTSTKPTGGMGKEAITKLWLAGFESDDPSIGGCPPCPATGPCPDSPQPAPPAPATRYHCDAAVGRCATASEGHSTLAKCEAACPAPPPAPPAGPYACVVSSGARQCQPVPAGFPGSYPTLQQCQLDCGS